MNFIDTLVLLLFAHFCADFLFQNKWMATNKSKSGYPLFCHIAMYTFILLCFSLFAFNNKMDAWYFAIFNGVLHYGVDFITSKLSSYMYRNNKMGTNAIPNINFWTVIGFDQLLHTVILIYSLSWFLNY